MLLKNVGGIERMYWRKMYGISGCISGLTTSSYWLDGYREEGEGAHFYWRGSRNAVKRGTPFWAIYFDDSTSNYQQVRIAML